MMIFFLLNESHLKNYLALWKNNCYLDIITGCATLGGCSWNQAFANFGPLVQCGHMGALVNMNSQSFIEVKSIVRLFVYHFGTDSYRK